MHKLLVILLFLVASFWDNNATTHWKVNLENGKILPQVSTFITQNRFNFITFPIFHSSSHLPTT